MPLSPKLSPFTGKVDTNECEWPKGERLEAAKCREMFPLSFAYAQQLPRKRWRLLVLHAVFLPYKKAPLYGELSNEVRLRG